MTEPEDEGGLLVTRLVVERRLQDDGDIIWTSFTRGDSDETPPLFETLGLLELAKDTAIREAMGEVPDDDEDETP